MLFDSGLSYSVLNTAIRTLSALIVIEEKLTGSNPLVIRLLKGAFKHLPSVTCDLEFLL